jgi:hypothetical protein
MNWLSLLLIPLCGCAYLSSKTQSTRDTNGFEIVTTRVRSYTLFDGEAQLAKFANRGTMTQSNQWAAGTTIGAMNQSSSSTNINELIGAVVQGAVKGAVMMQREQK